MAGEGSLNRIVGNTNIQPQTHYYTDIQSHPPLQDVVSVMSDSFSFSYLKLVYLFFLNQECVHEKQTAHLQESLGKKHQQTLIVPRCILPTNLYKLHEVKTNGI